MTRLTEINQRTPSVVEVDVKYIRSMDRKYISCCILSYNKISVTIGFLSKRVIPIKFPRIEHIAAKIVTILSSSFGI
jgi:hypothetical protein